MKGIIFTTFEAFITDSFGADVYEDILDDTELITTEPFVGPGTYPEADLVALLTTAVQKLGITVLATVNGSPSDVVPPGVALGWGVFGKCACLMAWPPHVCRVLVVAEALIVPKL